MTGDWWFRTSSQSSFWRTAERIDQSTDPVATLVENLSIFRGHITQVPAQQDEIPGFLKLSAGDLQAAQKLTRCGSTEPYSDIRGNRGTASPQLRNDSVLFSARESYRQLVNFECELMRFLPNRKVLK
jgi:hypothetical protein